MAILDLISQVHLRIPRYRKKKYTQIQNNDPALHVGTKLRLTTLREEHRSGVFENRVLGRIFEPKREEETE
jgi:hypothetical protein